MVFIFAVMGGFHLYCGSRGIKEIQEFMVRESKDFALIGVAGYVAPRDMRAADIEVDSGDYQIRKYR